MNKSNINIRIEKVGDVNFVYPYLEVFQIDSINPFLDIGIDNKQLSFKLYASNQDVIIHIDEWEYILNTAKAFLDEVLSDEKFINNCEIFKNIKCRTE